MTERARRAAAGPTPLKHGATYEWAGYERPEFTQEVLDALESPESGRYVRDALPTGGASPRIVYSEGLLESRNAFAEYVSGSNLLRLDARYLQEDPRLAASAVVHELSHRNRRHWSLSIYEEYRAHYIQQQIGQELEIGRIQVRTEFGEKVLAKQAELTQAVEDATLWDLMVQNYQKFDIRGKPLIPNYGIDYWSYPDPDIREIHRRKGP